RTKSDSGRMVDLITLWDWCIPRANLRSVVGSCVRRSGKPGLAFGVDLLHLWTSQPGQAEFHIEAVPALQIGKVAVAFRRRREQRRFGFQRCRRIHRVEPVLFVDRLPPDDGPFAIALLKE